MAQRRIQQSFAGGEVAETYARGDIARYGSQLTRCENYRTTPLGYAERRPGTLFVASTKFRALTTRLLRFVFNQAQSYSLEVGHLYIRFFTNLGQITVGGTPVEVATPYESTQVRRIQTAPRRDLLYLAHPEHPPARLVRTSDTAWAYEVLTFRPPPLFEGDTDLEATLTPSATTGSGVTFTASYAAFLTGDIDREIVSGTARAVITALVGASPSVAVTCTILDAFPSTDAIPVSAWTLQGSPSIALTVDKATPTGALVRCKLETEDETATELVINGDFATGTITGWADRSGVVISTGTAKAAGANLIDTTNNFVSVGVEVGHRVLNLTDGSEGRANEILTDAPGDPLLNDRIDLDPNLKTGTLNTWTFADVFQIRETGAVSVVANEARLDGLENGTAWMEQAVPTVVGKRYRWTFDVRDGPVSAMVGSATQLSDIVAEESHPIGNEHVIVFAATSTVSFLGFRNNQPQRGVVDNVSCKITSADGFRFEDVGKYLRVSNGTVEITRFIDAQDVEGIIIWPLDNTTTVAGGLWTLAGAAWSAARGYPRTVGFHQGRLGWGGTTQQPLTYWASVPGDFENHRVGTDDNAALEFPLDSNEMDIIEWVESLGDLFVGARGGESRIVSTDGPLTPSNRENPTLSSYGSESVRAVRLDTLLLMLQRGGRTVREFSTNVETGQLSTRDVTIVAEHIASGGIVEWAVQRQPVQTLWSIRADGMLLGFTLDFFEDVRGWHRHPTAGEWVSVETIPIDTPTTDETEEAWFIASRNGSQYVEVMRPCLTTPTTRVEALTLDSTLQYSGAPSTVLSGLDHLNGLTVGAITRESATYSDARGTSILGEKLTYLGQFLVTDGAITLPQAVTQADVGLEFGSLLETLPPEVPTEIGALRGVKVRYYNLNVSVVHSLGLVVNGETVPFRAATDALNEGLLPQTADMKARDTGWEVNQTIIVEQRQPLPSLITSITGVLEWSSASHP